MTNDAVKLFMFLDHSNNPLVKCLLIILPIFKNWYFFVALMIVLIICVFYM